MSFSKPSSPRLRMNFGKTLSSASRRSPFYQMLGTKRNRKINFKIRQVNRIMKHKTSTALKTQVFYLQAGLCISGRFFSEMSENGYLFLDLRIF